MPEKGGQHCSRLLVEVSTPHKTPKVKRLLCPWLPGDPLSGLQINDAAYGETTTLTLPSANRSAAGFIRPGAVPRRGTEPAQAWHCSWAKKPSQNPGHSRAHSPRAPFSAGAKGERGVFASWGRKEEGTHTTHLIEFTTAHICFWQINQTLSYKKSLKQEAYLQQAFMSPGAQGPEKRGHKPR